MRRPLVLLLSLLLLLAACGEETTPVTAGTDDGAAVSDGDAAPEPDTGDLDAAPEPDLIDPDAPVGDDMEIPNTPNPLSGVITNPTDVRPDPDDPSAVRVHFVGGDPNCTAAAATLLVETDTSVVVELVVGLTDDAAARSCLAGEFPLYVTVPLSQPLGDRVVDWSDPGPGDDAPIAVTPDLTTADFVGLTVGEAQEIAEMNIIDWRVTREDGEFFAVTEDYRPDRLNFEVDDGLISRVTLG